jgi:ADP-ribose pyrophosphatase YjhB (NUDIX family)
MEMRVRPTGVLMDNNRLLLVKQWVTATRGWSLPGGKLEPEETIEQCLKREMREETGLDILVKELLYITDRFFGTDIHIVHISFLVEHTGKKTMELEWSHDDPQPTKTATKIREIKMVPVDELPSYGFSPRYCQLLKDNFPGRGSYQGDYYTFYGETPPDGR